MSGGMSPALRKRTFEELTALTKQGYDHWRTLEWVDSRAAHRRDGERTMSRAFVNEDAGGGAPKTRFVLPERDDPTFDAVAAQTLLEAARDGDTESAERATGYYWGEPKLHAHVRRILAKAEQSGDDRLETLARRFLR